MLKKLLDWFDERYSVRRLWTAFADNPIPGGASWFYVLGATLLFLFILQMATGIALALYYVPTPDHAYDSVKFIQEEAVLGSFVRGLHHWGASFMMVIVALHMLRVFVFGAYKKPREIVWVLGVGLIALVGGFAFTGYLLPWDQKAYWATVVGTNVAGTVPVIGGLLLRIIRGGTELGAFALSRFYAIHTYILPWSLALFAGAHIFLLERAGAGGVWNAADRVPYRSEPLFPNQLFRDTLFMLLVFLALVSFAVLFPAPLEPVADPTDSTYNPRPEWYFYFVFQMLKIFEGRFELVGTVIIPTITIGLLVLVPFLDRRPERNPRKRPFMMAGASLFVIIVAALTIEGARAPIVNAPAVTSPSVLAGRALFQKSGCPACHSIHGKGGTVGPDLTRTAGRHDAAWLGKFLADPQAVKPGTVMPKPDLTEHERTDLVDYLMTLK
ncbi:MAG TPA: cytochrome b N-terminal domain-containing protein [Nitrospirota bacterium]|nr:cytochrome b N-terminal domain-containing protein [Nitrospirota bacterium]